MTDGYGARMTDVVGPEQRLLDGRYRLEDHLGSGGMGAVYRAHDLRLDREVAVKVLRDAPGGTQGDDVLHARLQSEARLAGSLQHPGIVRVFDYGEEPGPQGVTPYVVMQHVAGRPLGAVLREDGALAPSAVARLLQEIADALVEAHTATVVHRDLKPSNIIVRPDGRPVLVDFGIARSEGVEPLTQTGEILGTADYLSPEQVEGQRATPASDVYALGVVAYQCLTAVSPFHRETHVATAIARLHESAPPLPDTVPSGLRDLIHAMLLRDPARRPDAATVSARAAALGDGPATAAYAAPTGRERRLPAALRLGSRRALIAAGAAAVLVAGYLTWTIVGGDPVTPTAAAGAVVPDVRGESLTNARHDLRESGFEARVRRVDRPVPRGEVLRQSPRPDTPATEAQGEPVLLTVASGWVRLDDQELVGDTYAAATATLADLGLRAAKGGTLASSAPAGTVVGLAPDRDRVRVGSTIALVLATPPAPTPTPTHRPAHPAHHHRDPKPASHPAHPGHGHAATPKPKGHGKPKKPGKPGKSGKHH